MSDRLGAAIDTALLAVDRALANEMRTSDGASATPHLEQLRADLQAIGARGAISDGELRTMIRTVANWAPDDDVSLLSALGLIAQVRGRERDGR